MKEDHETNQFIISLYAFNSSLLNVVLNKLKKKNECSLYADFDRASLYIV